jgi:hypothetical protein
MQDEHRCYGCDRVRPVGDFRQPLAETPWCIECENRGIIISNEITQFDLARELPTSPEECARRFEEFDEMYCHQCFRYCGTDMPDEGVPCPGCSKFFCDQHVPAQCPACGEDLREFIAYIDNVAQL